MPARVWRHGIHSSLEVLNHGLPDSRDPMLVLIYLADSMMDLLYEIGFIFDDTCIECLGDLAFIYLAYSMMALIYETVSIFDDTWIECLGDLARYKMAIEDDDIRERETWTRVVKFWYSKASAKSPTIGRLYHHLAILARSSARSRQYHAKSLFCQFPFLAARESILTLFQPFLSGENGQRHCRPLPLDNVFVGAHGLLFKKDMDTFDSTITQFIGLLEDQIGRVTAEILVQRYQVGVINDASILDFRYRDTALMKAMFSLVADLHEQVEESEGSPPTQLEDAILPYHRKLEGLLSSIDDPNMLSFLHVNLFFLYRKSRHPTAMTLIEAGSSWKSLALYLNTLQANYDTPRIYIRPLPEDYCIRGLSYVDQCHPNTWFNYQERDEDEKGMELPSMIVQRQERILWFGRSITKVRPCIAFDSKILYFLPSKFAVDTGPVLITEQQGYQIAVTNSVGMSKLIAKGLSLMQSVTRSSEDNSHSKQSSFWTDSPSSQQSSSSRRLHLFDVIQTHGHHAHHDSQSNPSGRQVPPSIESNFAFTNVNRVVSLIRYTRVVKRFLQRQSARLFCKKDLAFIVALAVMFGNLPNAMARPLNTSTSSALSAEEDDSGFSQYWKDMWNQFKDQYSGPLVMNIIWAIFLASLFFLVIFHDKGRWKDTDLLAITTWCTSAASFFLGMGDWLSDWQLALLWVFNAKLNLRLLGRNLFSLPRSRDLTAICIITMGFVSAGTLAQRVPLEDGRYANHWILTAMLAPFMTCFVIHTWSVFIRDTGIARGLEEGTYNRVTARLGQQIYRLSQQIFLAIVALIVLRLLS